MDGGVAERTGDGGGNLWLILLVVGVAVVLLVALLALLLWARSRRTAGVPTTTAPDHAQGSPPAGFRPASPGPDPHAMPTLAAPGQQPPPTAAAPPPEVPPTYLPGSGPAQEPGPGADRPTR